MTGIKRITITVLMMILVLPLAAQEEKEAGSARGDRVWQLSGLVVDKQTREPVPYATIQINHSSRGILANEEGFYSIPVTLYDTLYMSSLGYKPGVFLVSEYLRTYQGDKSSIYLFTINYLDQDTILLPDVVIFPYNTPEKLKTAMLAIETPQKMTDMHARQNLDPATLHYYMEHMPKDAGEKLIIGRNMYYRNYQTQNLVPSLTIFNPMAVMQLLNYINEQSRKKNKDLNYWEEE